MVIDATYLKISISHVGESRNILPLIITFCIQNGALGLSKVTSIKISVFVQDFCASHLDRTAFFHKGSIYYRYSSMVLAEVQDYRVFSLYYFYWLQSLMVLDFT